MRRRCLVVLLLLLGSPRAHAAEILRQDLKKPATWFASDEAKTIAANILSHQSPLGGWPKNTDTTKPYTGDRDKLKPTFDNSATTDELRFVARIFNATNDPQYKTAFEKGYDYILKAQYPTGGWPQFYPPPEKTYHRHITFNDDAMVRLMNFLRETYTDDAYTFLDADRKTSARAAFDRGIDCILKCQIKIDGRLTAWCAQHDEKDFSPRPARAFELASLSGAETVGIVRLLMSLENPKPEVKQAIQAAVAWLESGKLTGIAVIKKNNDKQVIAEASAPPLWARFYDLKTNKPLFADRDGVPKSSLAEIGHERRNGYAWYGNWPQPLLEKEYPFWKSRHP